MSSIVERNFYKLQSRTTHVIIEQKVLLSEQQQVNNFLDRINSAKSDHVHLIADYKTAIEWVVSFLENSKTKEELITVAEAIHNLVSTTKRMIKLLGEGKTKNSYNSEIKIYKVLLNDINDILEDINNRITDDAEMANLLDSL